MWERNFRSAPPRGTIDGAGDRRPVPARIEAGMGVLIATVCLVLLGSAISAIRRRARARRRRRHEQRWPHATWATENSALRMLRDGTLTRKDYRETVEAIAAYDALRRPVDMPAPSTGAAPRA